MMNIANAFIFAFIMSFQLASSHQVTCGEAQVVQISDEMRNASMIRFPWAGALYSVVNKTATGDIKYICGSTIISKSFSVTGKQSPLLFISMLNNDIKIPAGHCIHDKQSDDYRRLASHIILYLGLYDMRQRNATTSEIDEIILHPNWDPHSESYDSDIALLKLRNAIIFSNLISPICLWPLKINEPNGIVLSWTQPEEGDPGYWNYEYNLLHNYPRHFNMPIRSNTECLLKQPRFKDISSERTYCAGGLNSGPCLEVGNSGASMAVETNGKFYLRGIVSASFIDIAGCDNITFSLFTDVVKHKYWIIENIGE